MFLQQEETGLFELGIKNAGEKDHGNESRARQMRWWFKRWKSGHTIGAIGYDKSAFNHRQYRMNRVGVVSSSVHHTVLGDDTDEVIDCEKRLIFRAVKWEWWREMIEATWTNKSKTHNRNNNRRKKWESKISKFRRLISWIFLCVLTTQRLDNGASSLEYPCHFSFQFVFFILFQIFTFWSSAFYSLILHYFDPRSSLSFDLRLPSNVRCLIECNAITSDPFVSFVGSLGFPCVFFLSVLSFDW